MNLILILTFLLAPMSIFSQDVIVSKLGKKTLCKIDKISETTVEYHLWDNLTGPTFIVSLKNIKEYILEKKTETLAQIPVSNNVIVQEKATVQETIPKNQAIVPSVAQPANQPVNQLNPTSDNSNNIQGQYYLNGSQRNALTKSNTTVLGSNLDLFQQGRNDAKMYYTGYKGAGTGTFLTSFLLSPVLGLIPAIACSSTAPNASNFTFPNSALTREPDYMSGYMQEAKKKKSGKVWGNFAIGTVLAIVTVFTLSRIN